MKKLTLEKAQELLEFLKGKAATGDITMSQENYLQAMELAVMALSAKQAKPVAYMYRDILHSDARFSLTSQIGNWSSEEISEHEITEIPLYTTPQPAHTEQIPDICGFDPALAGSEATVITNYFTPDGWKLVPIEPTEDMVVNGFESKPDKFFSPDIEWEAYDAMSGCEQAAHRAKLCWAAMIAAAPKPEAL